MEKGKGRKQFDLRSERVDLLFQSLLMVPIVVLVVCLRGDEVSALFRLSPHQIRFGSVEDDDRSIKSRMRRTAVLVRSVGGVVTGPDQRAFEERKKNGSCCGKS